MYEYAANEMQNFQAEWNLPKPLKMFAVAQGSIKNSGVSQSLFLAGGLGAGDFKSKSVYRVFLDLPNRKCGAVLGTDMLTGLCYRCEQLPDMLVARYQFALVFQALNQTDYELYAIGGTDQR